MGQLPVTIQPKERRLGNFREVSLGYPKKLALEESARCPQCADPVCMQGCPLGIDIPGFIRLIREGNTPAALKKIKEENPLPSVCGRICPAPCETLCVLTKDDAAIGIRALERFAADNGKEKSFFSKQKTCTGKKIAVIGSGPTGLAAASLLAAKDYQVTVFEAMEKPGGILRAGVPEFRLSEELLSEEISALIQQGVVFKTNVFFNQREHIKRLFQDGMSAVVLAVGAGAPVVPNISGVNLGGVFFAREFLMRANHYKAKRIRRDSHATYAGHSVVVIGSNHAALDCARSAARLRRDVTLVFPHVEGEMKGFAAELEQAKEEGVKVEPLTKVLEISGNAKKFVTSVKAVRMDFADPRSNGQWQVIPVEGSEFILPADTVILSHGQQRNKIMEGLVGMEGIFVPEPSATADGSVVEAIAAGKKIAEQIDQYLNK